MPRRTLSCGVMRFLDLEASVSRGRKRPAAKDEYDSEEDDSFICDGSSEGKETTPCSSDCDEFDEVAPPGPTKRILSLTNHEAEVIRKRHPSLGLESDDQGKWVVDNVVFVDALVTIAALRRRMASGDIAVCSK